MDSLAGSVAFPCGLPHGTLGKPVTPPQGSCPTLIDITHKGQVLMMVSYGDAVPEAKA